MEATHNAVEVRILSIMSNSYVSMQMAILGILREGGEEEFICCIQSQTSRFAIQHCPTQ
jgi:hypothetical protein